MNNPFDDVNPEDEQMTEKQAKELAKKALPCPFCGEDLIAKSDHHGWWVGHVKEPGECFESTAQLFSMDDVDRWNVRDGLQHDVKS